MFISCACSSLNGRLPEGAAAGTGRGTFAALALALALAALAFALTALALTALALTALALTALALALTALAFTLTAFALGTIAVLLELLLLSELLLELLLEFSALFPAGTVLFSTVSGLASAVALAPSVAFRGGVLALLFALLFPASTLSKLLFVAGTSPVLGEFVGSILFYRTYFRISVQSIAVQTDPSSVAGVVEAAVSDHSYSKETANCTKKHLLKEM